PAGRRTHILMESGAFSSDRHAVASQIAWRGLDPEAALIELGPVAGEDTLSEEAIDECFARHGEEIALVLWPGVQFRTGQAFDLGRITRAAHRHGCVVGFDLAHSIGNTLLALHETQADFAVWCSYKYLNGGPGAIGGWLEQLLRPLAEQVHVITPRESARRGCQLSLRITGGAARGARVFEALSESGVVCDWRSPDIIRVAPVPLYNRFEDVWQFARTLGDVLRGVA